MMQLALIVFAQIIFMIGIVSGVLFIKKRLLKQTTNKINGLDLLPVLSLIYVVILSFFTGNWSLLFGYLLAWAVVLLLVSVIKVFSNKPLTRFKLLKTGWRMSDLITPILWLIVVGLSI